MRPQAVSSVIRLNSKQVLRISPSKNLSFKSSFTFSPKKKLNTTTTFTNHIRSFSSSSPAKMSAPFLEFVKARRTYYPLSKDLTISKDKVTEIVKEAVQHCPSSFNAQMTRAVVLFGDEHEKLWEITKEVLKGIVPAESFKPTEDKLNMFKAAAGSVLFFEDTEVVDGQQKAFPLYAANFPIWASQADAMLQFTVWTALEAEGLGANLQHYNPVIDEKVAAQWKIPSTWKLNAQLVFGGKTGDAGAKDFKPVEDKVKVFGA